jgi:hypothetical protein
MIARLQGLGAKPRHQDEEIRSEPLSPSTSFVDVAVTFYSLLTPRYPLL